VIFPFAFLLGALYQGETLEERRAVKIGEAQASEENPYFEFKLKQRNVTSESDPRVKSMVKLLNLYNTAIIYSSHQDRRLKGIPSPL